MNGNNNALTATVYYLDWQRPEMFGRDSPEFHRFMNLMRGRENPTVEEVQSSKAYFPAGKVELPAEDLYHLEALWFNCQNGVGAGTRATLGVARRSMCVGDVVKVNGNFYVAANAGFERVMEGA